MSSGERDEFKRGEAQPTSAGDPRLEASKRSYAAPPTKGWSLRPSAGGRADKGSAAADFGEDLGSGLESGSESASESAGHSGQGDDPRHEARSQIGRGFGAKEARNPGGGRLDDDFLSSDSKGESQERGRKEKASRGVRRLLAERILAGLSESGDVIRRGQGLVSDVAQTTRDEVRRIAAAELRGLVDELDLSELIQDVVAGMVVEVKGEIRFRKSEEGVVPEIRHQEAKLRRDSESDDDTEPAQSFDDPVP